MYDSALDFYENLEQDHETMRNDFQKLLKFQEEISSQARFRSISIIMASLAIAIITTGITLVFQSGSEIATTAALTIVTGILTLLVSFFTVYFYRKH